MAVTQLAQAVCSVQIVRVFVLAKLVIKETNVMLLAVAIPLVQVGQRVTSPLVNVPVTLDTQVLHVIPVLPTIIEKVMELVQVSVLSLILYFKR